MKIVKEMIYKKFVLDTDDTQQKNNINTSIYYLSNKEIDEDITSEENIGLYERIAKIENVMLFLLNENDENTLHFELQNESGRLETSMGG